MNRVNPFDTSPGGQLNNFKITALAVDDVRSLVCPINSATLTGGSTSSVRGSNEFPVIVFPGSPRSDSDDSSEVVSSATWSMTTPEILEKGVPFIEIDVGCETAGSFEIFFDFWFLRDGNLVTKAADGSASLVVTSPNDSSILKARIHLSSEISLVNVRFFVVKISRDSGDADDTVTGPVYLHSARLAFL